MNDSEKTIHIAPPHKIQMAVVVAVSMLALFLLVQTISAFENLGRPTTPPMNLITVQGSGKASAVPDIAQITFGVTQTATTVAEAQSAATKQTNAALDAVKGMGIAEKDIKTTSYNISPQYSYPRPCYNSICPADTDIPKVIGYQVSQSIQLTVRDLEKVGDLLATLGKLNVQNLYGPNFTLEDPTAPQNEARAEAIMEARMQAKQLAKDLGVRLGKIVNFNEGGNYPMYAMAYGKGGDVAMSPEAAPQVPTGENEYTSNVTITYEIR
jgi:uncharacterized protein YggE